MFAILVIAACTPTSPPSPPQALAEPVPGAPISLDQRWSDQDRTRFATTAQGSHLMPLPWFLALRRIDRDEAFAADQLTRYGYLPSARTLPVGFVPDGTAREPQLGMTCADVVTGQVHMLPSKRGEVGQQMVGRVFGFAQGGDGAFEVAGVPQDDRGDEQVEAGGAVLLVLVGAVADLAETVEEHGPRQAVAGLALVELLAGRAPQLGIVDAVERE